MNYSPNCIYHTECHGALQQLESDSVDLVFVDPPFNFGIDYDQYNDTQDAETYWLILSRILKEIFRVSRHGGTIWLALPDEWVSRADVLFAGLGCERRNWIIWHYHFGQACATKFARCKTHLLYYVKPGASFTFNADEIRVPSARQTKYNDRRAVKKGKVPEDVWDIPRIAGTHGERVGWHPTQMPLAIMERIILSSSNPGDLVLDPVAGSGTTLVAAAVLKRQWLGFDISEKYVKSANNRIAEALKK